MPNAIQTRVPMPNDGSLPDPFLPTDLRSWARLYVYRLRVSAMLADGEEMREMDEEADLLERFIAAEEERDNAPRP